MKIVVTFKNGSVKKFNCDTWNFSDISNNNVWLINEGDVTVHLNWVEVLSIEKLR